jgi:hypothetical protein
VRIVAQATAILIAFLLIMAKTSGTVSANPAW